MKKLQHWLKQVMGYDLARSTLHRILQAVPLRWKKCQKVFKKADPHKRADFMTRFHKLYAQLHRQKIRLVYVDEAHIHRDMDLGYTWTRKNQIAWRMSDSAPLSDRINWYGAYDFGAGQCFIWNEGSCNKEHTIQFLQRMAEWLGDGPALSWSSGMVPPGIEPKPFRLPPPNSVSFSAPCLPTAPTSIRLRISGAGCEKRSRTTTAIRPCDTSSMPAKPSSTVSMHIPKGSCLVYGLNLNSTQSTKNSWYQIELTSVFEIALLPARSIPRHSSLPTRSANLFPV